MPSKLGFGNSRTPMTKKASYGSAMHYKNPVKLTENAKTKIMASDANPEFKAAISKASVAKMYGKSPTKIFGSKKREEKKAHEKREDAARHTSYVMGDKAMRQMRS